MAGNVVIKITVALTDTGEIGIEGPLENKVLCYGLLEAGKVAVTQFGAAEEKRIIPAPPGSAQFLASMKDGK